MLRMPPQVLVVDDDSVICELVEEALTDDGCDVQTRTRGRDALEFLQHHVVDVMLLDLRLHDIDLETFLAECRGQGDGNTPIILFSADTGLDHHARRLGVRDWLEKPFDISDLCEIVRQCAFQAQANGDAVRSSDGR